MVSQKATLIKRTCVIGQVGLDVPEGYVYTVYPETIKTVDYTDLDTGQKGSIQLIMTDSRGTSKAGWFPLECLKLEDS